MGEELAAEVAAAIGSAYDYPEPLSCRFLRQGFNDHYRAEAGDTEYHVRLYLDGKYYIAGDDDLRAELALTASLADAGCRVARPLPGRDGDLLTIATIAARPRRLAVFEVAPGGVVRAPNATAVERLGTAVADIHTAADTAGPQSRYHLDRRYLLEQPVEQLRLHAGDLPEVDAIAQLADELGAVLAEVPTDGGSYGMIHGDLHLGNVHFDGDVPTIFDLDHCGHGWRAYDLAPLRMAFDEPTWDGFVRAYRGRRELPPGLDHIDDFVRMRVLWDVGDLLAIQTTWGTTKISDQLRQQLPKLAAHLGLSPDTGAPTG